MRTLTGAILIHAACTLGAAGEPVNVLWWMPAFVGVFYLIWGSAADFPEMGQKAANHKAERQ